MFFIAINKVSKNISLQKDYIDACVIDITKF